MSFPFFHQTDAMSCGATCLNMICAYYGKTFNLKDLNRLTGTTREGATLLGLSEAARKLGFTPAGLKLSFADLLQTFKKPCIAHWNSSHFVVVYKIKSNKILVADPGHGLLSYSFEEFQKYWSGDGEGILLTLEITPAFYDQASGLQPEDRKNTILNMLKHQMANHRRPMLQVFFYLVLGSLLQLLFPFFTQSVVDQGIRNKDIHFIYVILMAQLFVFIGRATVDVLKDLLLTHISSRVNIEMLAGFFRKLMKLPISYFDVKMTGDIMQRINDNYRVEQFLTGNSLRALFSMLNFVIFSIVLLIYSVKIFAVFFAGSLLYFLWVTSFLKKRAQLDYKLFQNSGQNQSKIIEIINGMQEIKLFSAEKGKLNEFEEIQMKLYRIKLNALSLTQWQNTGSSLINELKNILITFLTAKLVIDAELSLGVMLSISYITGYLNGPVNELVDFIRQMQDARLSFNRLSEIHTLKEEDINTPYNPDDKLSSCIELKNLSFKYEGLGNEYVLKDLNFQIPSNKVTAIVGSSGSGKTTLIKLLLKFYQVESGDILVNGTSLNGISSSGWIRHCGSVMQDGYIFSDTILKNITLGDETVDNRRLKNAVRVANIKEFVEQLPLNYDTRIGMEGYGLSTGQKQRILIARAVYKDPAYLFFDEATSALDANNEKTIMHNLSTFYQNRTVVVIAHRLSTVKNADNILVLDKGRIVEQGTHSELTSNRSVYYELVKNQLELE